MEHTSISIPMSYTQHPTQRRFKPSAVRSGQLFRNACEILKFTCECLFVIFTTHGGVGFLFLTKKQIRSRNDFHVIRKHWPGCNNIARKHRYYVLIELIQIFRYQQHFCHQAVAKLCKSAVSLWCFKWKSEAVSWKNSITVAYRCVEINTLFV